MGADKQLSTYERKAEAEQVLTARLISSPYDLPAHVDRLNESMFSGENKTARACLALHRRQMTYSVFEVANECGRRVDGILQLSMKYPDVDLETAVEAFIKAHEMATEETIAASVPYWIQKGMATDDIRRESEKARRSAFIGVSEKADDGKQGFESSLIASLDGKRMDHPVEPFLRCIREKVPYFRPGEYIMAAGRTGMGKSYFALNQLHHSAKAGVPGLYINLENDPESVQERLWQMQTGQRFENPFHGLTDAQNKEYLQAWEDVKRLPIYAKNTGRRLVNVISCIRRHYYEYGIGLAAVDYVQLIRAGDKAQRFDDIAETSASLRMLALELKIPIIVAAQINRAAENNSAKRPTIADLRGSGDLEQDATMVFLLYRPSYYGLTEDEAGMSYYENYADVTLGKGRNVGQFKGQCQFNPVLGFHDAKTEAREIYDFTIPKINRSEDVPF